MSEYKLIHDEDLDGEMFYYVENSRSIQVSPCFANPIDASRWFEINIRGEEYQGEERRSLESESRKHGRRAGDVDFDAR